MTEVTSGLRFGQQNSVTAAQSGVTAHAALRCVEAEVGSRSRQASQLGRPDQDNDKRVSQSYDLI